jgi:hypothetical protein
MYGTREFLTDEELAEVAKEAAENRAKVERGDVDPVREGDVGTYNRFWQDPGIPPKIYNRTSLIVDPPDGQIPYTAEGKRLEDRATARYGHGPWNSYLDIDTGERCLSDGLTTTMFRDTAGGFKEIIQSPGYVLIQQEQFRDRRIIALDGRPRRSAIRQWYGQGRGRWEGNTLVVETTNFIDRPDWEWNNIYQRPTDTLRLVERWTRVAPDTIEYKMTVEDPKTFTRPWTVVAPLSKTAETTRLYEYACHEGSISVENTLRGARAEEAAAAKKTTPK